jgi:uncharacterized tellurite resistance protein B-like protein
MSLPSWLLSTRHADVLESLRQLAWSDGVLSDSERVMIVKLVNRLGINPTNEELAAWLASATSPGTHAAMVQGSFERRYLISQAIRISYEDGEYSEVEERLILDWAAGWGIDKAEVHQIEEEILAEKANADPFRA